MAVMSRLRASLAAAVVIAAPLFAVLVPGGVAAAAEPGDADLHLAFPVTGGQYPAGQPFSFAFEVGNSGPADATGVVVTLVFPAGLAPAYTTTSCTPVPTGLSCSYPMPSIPAGETFGQPLFLTASSPGTYRITGSVSADQPDPVPGDNTATADVTIVASADLSVTVQAAAQVTGKKTEVQFTVTVVNRGPSTATAVVLNDSWSSTTSGGVALRSFTTDAGTCTAMVSGVDCTLGDLEAGATATLTVTLRVKGSGSVTDTAQASSAVYEVYPYDNTATATVRVGG